jgi:catechol-2,3-dioxygenase
MSLLPSAVLSHLGINVTDIDRMERFYASVFGFVVSDRGVRFNGQKVIFLTKDADDHHQMVLLEGRPAGETFNVVNQISFGLRSLAELRAAVVALEASGVGGIVQVDHGNSWSIYFHDPEGNPIEVFVDSPFHTPQPCRGELDLSQPVDAILARTEALCRSRPGFALREEWQQTVGRRLQAALESGGGHA